MVVDGSRLRREGPRTELSVLVGLCSDNGSWMPKFRAIVVGGGGYVGLRLGLALSALGKYEVVLLDCFNEPDPAVTLPKGVAFVAGDVRDVSSLVRCFAGADVVFHVASFGMSGRQQLMRRLIQEVNVQGTKNVIAACLECGVERLVYTSTYNVCFGGEPIVNGDESLPYFPVHRHPDNYSRTKAMAEQAVLAANGSKLAGSPPGGPRCLRSSVIRPAGIYGPGEQRHLVRVVSYLEKGLFKFVYGSPDTRVDFVHVDNLVQAHILAADGLTLERQHIAAGQAYFISDDQPINNFEFFRPLVEGLGYPFPTLRLPLTLVYYVAFLTEALHAMVWRLYNFQPLLTRAEVLKTGVTHFFSMAKAKRDLGYQPQHLPFDPVVDWFRERGHGKLLRRGIAGAGSSWGVLGGWMCWVAMAALCALAALYCGLVAETPSAGQHGTSASFSS